jgi:hypothetical protein
MASDGRNPILSAFLAPTLGSSFSYDLLIEGRGEPGERLEGAKRGGWDHKMSICTSLDNFWTFPNPVAFPECLGSFSITIFFPQLNGQGLCQDTR